jgi:hypothetical protein
VYLVAAVVGQMDGVVAVRAAQAAGRRSGRLPGHPVVVGVAVTLLSAAQHRRILQRLDRGEDYLAPRWSLGLVVSVLLALLGAAMVAYLLLASP